MFFNATLLTNAVAHRKRILPLLLDTEHKNKCSVKHARFHKHPLYINI